MLLAHVLTGIAQALLATQQQRRTYMKSSTPRAPGKCFCTASARFIRYFISTSSAVVRAAAARTTSLVAAVGRHLRALGALRGAAGETRRAERLQHAQPRL